MEPSAAAFAPARNEDLANAISHVFGREARDGGETRAGALPGALLRPAPCCSEREWCSREGASRVRRKLWQLAPGTHCSLLGVCLGLDEMRRLAVRIGLCASARVSDYELHHQLVHIARSADRQGRRLDRYLAEKFAHAVRAFRVHRDEAALRAGWDRALEAEEDLGGAYWALLTHPALSDALANEALGRVHMLSHAAAAALRRARAELEGANARLAEQTRALEREHAIRARQTERLKRLEERLAERERAVRSLVCAEAGPAAARGQEAPRCGSAADPDAALQALRARLEKSEHERRAWRGLYRRSQQRLEAPGPDPDPDRTSALSPARESAPTIGAPDDGVRELEHEPPPPCNLAGQVVAYIGGRDHIVPGLRALTERCNGRFVHHDGGRQERAGRIDEGLAGSDLLVVPVDCVSHDASRRLKRRCRRQGKTILWLRTASLSAFESALQQLAQTREAV